MLRWAAIAVALVVPFAIQAQRTSTDARTVCANPLDQDAPAPPAGDKKTKKAKKSKALKDNVVPLSLVVCEVENALDAYEQSPEVADKKVRTFFRAYFRQTLILRPLLTRKEQSE